MKASFLASHTHGVSLISPSCPVFPDGSSAKYAFTEHHILPLLTFGIFCKQLLQQDNDPLYHGFPTGASDKESSCQCRRHRRLGFDPWVGKIIWRRKWQPTLVFLPGEFHGQRSPVGYSPWGHKELDMSEQTRSHSHTHVIVCFELWTHFFLSEQFRKQAFHFMLVS